MTTPTKEQVDSAIAYLLDTAALCRTGGFRNEPEPLEQAASALQALQARVGELGTLQSKNEGRVKKIVDEHLVRRAEQAEERVKRLTEALEMREGDYYSDSVHVTAGGGIGINCGGHVIVLPLRKWHQLAAAAPATAKEKAELLDRARQYLQGVKGRTVGQALGDADDVISDLLSALERSEQSLQQAIKLLRDVAAEDERPYDLNEIVRFLTTKAALQAEEIRSLLAAARGSS